MKKNHKTFRFSLLLSSFLLSAAMATAQITPDRVHIGLMGGLHNTMTSFSNLDSRYFDDPKSVSGFSGGLFAEFELGRTRMFSIRPEILLLSRGTKIEDIKYVKGTGTGQLDYNLKASYFDLRVPLMVNFGHPGGVRPYIFLSPILGLVSGGEIKAEDAVTTYSVDVSKANMASMYFAVAPGAGIKIPAGPVELGIEASYELGLTDTYGSKEKDGKALATLFFPTYDIQGTRKFSGLELMAHVSGPLSVFKTGAPKRTVIHMDRKPTSSGVTIRHKPCYDLDEILSFIAKGESVDGMTICAIDQINFEYGKSTLTRSSREYIDKIISLMKRTGMSVEIKGHTDSKGSDELNMDLSRRRAEAVYNYMISKGVKANKLSYSYYGESRPIESNDTEEGRRINRRVEFEIK